jgi:hypothetical protein
MSLQSLTITSRLAKERFIAVINGADVPLTWKSYRYLIILAAAHDGGNFGWVQKGDLEGGENQARYIYRLVHEVWDGIQDRTPFIVNNRLGFYKLQCDTPPAFDIDDPGLIPDHDVRSLLIKRGAHVA